MHKGQERNRAGCGIRSAQAIIRARQESLHDFRPALPLKALYCLHYVMRMQQAQRRATAMDATLNVRFPGKLKDLKRRGDAVLAREGISTSEAVRGL